MNSFRELTPRMKVITAAILGLVGSAALGGGILAASLQEAISQTPPDTSASTKLLVAPSASSANASVTLRVEVVRDGETLCRGEGTPSMYESGYQNEYYLKPITDCPQLQDGDAVGVTWIQSTKVNISSAK
ncbi:hypothetical protein EVB87_277 [Rhizobium phage RHph_N28_1]|nr:hypothetical protein EVB87_277 [Rhizobium phage RHph_N28_1]QIG74305.1 hypothetical protein EVC07_277 [Rhizobium phage RHph_N42]QIG74914.1 hypothetical protein EVC12_279 [Rhizobium phage RHph_I42]QXV73964.1 hypothetical protein [Rhizobium phage RHph_N46]